MLVDVIDRARFEGDSLFRRGAAVDERLNDPAKLFADAIAWLEAEGRRRIWISVWSENFGAQRFYARHGFAKVAEYEFPVGRQRDIEFMYRRDAAAA